ncbi:transposable element Tcb1 transposase [Trichonephila clavipes]|nr:transposable element Tcb1 transposase [Trichonephila clavipes]
MVSRQTLYRCLGHIGLHARWPVRCVPLTATYCRQRLAWSREHAMCVWTSSRGAMSLEFVFMDDNALLHRANIVYEYLQDEDITRIEWTAFSPDLNPIQHVWDILVRLVAALQPPPTFVPGLRRA